MGLFLNGAQCRELIVSLLLSMLECSIGHALWIDCCACSADTLDELAASFENISYPSLPPSLTEPMASSFGFASSAPNLNVSAAAPAKKEEEEGEGLVDGFSVVETPTPVLSLASNDSFHQAPPPTNAKDNG